MVTNPTMKAVVEISENGTVQLPAEVLPHVKHHVPYEVHAEDGKVVLAPVVDTKPFWATAGRHEWAKAFEKWVLSHKEGPGLPDEMLRREFIYD